MGNCTSQAKLNFMLLDSITRWLCTYIYMMTVFTRHVPIYIQAAEFTQIAVLNS